MSKNFTSVVKLVESLQPEGEKNAAIHTSSINTGSNFLQIQDRTVTLPAIQPLPLSPLRNTQLQEIRFGFDRVFGPSDGPDAIYKQSVKEIVESCLLGYHATVVSFGTELDREQTGNREHGVLISKAAEQIFRCLKKSRRSKSKSRSSTSNLVVLCSYAIIIQEKVYDLLFGYDRSSTQQSTAEASRPIGVVGGDENTIDIELPPELQLLNGSILGASQHKVKNGKKLAPLLKFGRETESKIIEFERLRQSRKDGSSPHHVMQGVYQTLPENTHHTVLTLTVEYSQFGSMNAPVSGNLMFVDMAASDPIANRQRHTTGDHIASEFVSLFTFVDVIDSLTSNATAIEGMGSSGSTYNIDGEGTQLPCVPETASKELYQNSLLTQVLQDSLGGNCKTLLVTYVPELVLPARYGEMYETLKLASRARMIQNTPNKRDLAEKALMSAYMRGLQEMYGQGVLAKQEQRKPRRARIVITSSVSPFQGEAEDGGGLESKKALSASKDSLSSGDIDTAYDEMINMTEGEKRQQNMELAATALVAAALEDREEEEGAKRTASGDDELSSREEDSDSESRENSETNLQHSSKHDDATALQTKLRLKKKKKAPIDPRQAALLGGGSGGLESASVSSLTERDVTIDVLVNIIQDPDKGVPRPPASALKADVKIKKDAGSIFCGAELVKWMVQNIDGVENEDDAETLGQLLLDKGALFHTEGSKVFANAESLFYYTTFSRPTKKLLSQEEIRRLLAQATTPSDGPGPTTCTSVSAVERRKESTTVVVNQGDMAVVELGDSQASIDHEAVTIPKSKENQTAGINCNRGDMSITELEESQLSIDREATTVRKLKENPSITNHEGMAIVDVDDDEGQTKNDRMNFNQHDTNANNGHTCSSRAGDQQQTLNFAESDVQKVALDDMSYGREVSATDGQAESSGGTFDYGGAANGRISDTDSTQYTYEVQDVDENTTNYEDQIEQAQAELLKRQEEDSGQPNTVAQEHIPSVQTLEKTTNYPHPLHMAVAIGKSSGVVRQLVMMFGVNKRDEYNRTPLMFAALGNNKSSSCSTLIDCGAEVDQQDICGLTALHVACYHGNKAAVSVLLNRKASVCVFDNTEHSVYHWSTVPDDHACLQLLMSVATPEVVMYADRFGLTALHWAISYDHSDHLKLLLKMCKEPLKHDSEGRTLLTYSIQQQAMQCIRILLSAHPSLLTHADTNGAYPLHHAAVQKSPQFLEVLLSHKLPKKSQVSVDVNCRNGTGQTPLHCVVAYNRLQNATVLVSRGANVEAADDEGKTCLDYANALGDGDRELMLNTLTGGTESSAQASGELANPSKQSKQASNSSRSKVCTIL